jgi:hypothetical protein
VISEPLVKRRELEPHGLPRLAEPIRYSPILEAGLKDPIRPVKGLRILRVEWTAQRRCYAT